jgi:hypothetical protein
LALYNGFYQAKFQYLVCKGVLKYNIVLARYLPLQYFASLIFYTTGYNKIQKTDPQECEVDDAIFGEFIVSQRQHTDPHSQKVTV